MALCKSIRLPLHLGTQMNGKLRACEGAVNANETAGDHRMDASQELTPKCCLASCKNDSWCAQIYCSIFILAFFCGLISWSKKIH